MNSTNPSTGDRFLVLHHPWSRVGLFLFFLLAGLWASWPAARAFFVADDFGYIFKIRQIGAAAVWTIPSDRFVRPGVWFFYWLDYRLWGLNPTGYHLTNLILHAVNALWVTLIAWELFRLVHPDQKPPWVPSAGAGLLFLLHPSHTEAVSWISGRSDVIATFWILPSLFYYLKYKRTSARRFLVGSASLYALSLLSKESGVTYPFLILILDWSCRMWIPPAGHSRWNPVVYFAILAAYMGLRRLILNDWIGGYGFNIHARFDFAFLERNFYFLTARTLLPPMEYPIHGMILRLGRLGLLLVFATLAGVGMAWWWNRRTRRREFWGIHSRRLFLLIILLLMYLAALAPVLNLSIHLGSSLGERLIYLPGVFIILAGVFIVHWVSRWTWLKVLLLGILAVVYANQLYQSNRHWENAGRITRQIVHDLTRLEPARRLFILNLPDTIGGAYVFRNGIKPALNLFGDSARLREIRVVAYQTLFELTDGVEIRQESAETYEVKTASPRTYFLNRRIPPSDLAFFHVRDRDRFRFTVRFPNQTGEDRMAYYSRGSLREIP